MEQKKLKFIRLIHIVGASEASPLVSHARGPGGVCSGPAWTDIRYLLL